MAVQVDNTRNYKIQAETENVESLSEFTTNGLEAVVENNLLILYADSKTGNTALFNKSDGTYWHSNPEEYHGKELVGQEMVLSASQIEIKYYDLQFLESQ